MISKQGSSHSTTRFWLSLVVRMTLFAVALMWPAGIWYWWEAWVVICLWTIFGVIMTNYLLHNDPKLLSERMKLIPLQKEQKPWDKVIMLIFFIAAIALYIIPGFDVVRYEWSDPLPLWMRILAVLLHFPCFVMLGWVMRQNTYLAQVVKIDKQRDHHVITTGPYELVRHPMYTITIVLLFAMPVVLGSRFALILSVFLAVLLIVRTYLEDRTLYSELKGYPEYTKQTPYRLIPWVW